MSTRSWISIQIISEDIGKKRRFNPELLPLKLDIHSVWEKDIEYHLPEVELSNFLTTYCHMDGYPSGVGRILLADYNSYEKALNLILGGYYSTICGDEYHCEDYSKNQDLRIHNFLTYNYNHDNTGRVLDFAEVWNNNKPVNLKSEDETDPNKVYPKGHMIAWSYMWKDNKWWIKPSRQHHNSNFPMNWTVLTEEYIKKHPE